MLLGLGVAGAGCGGPQCQGAPVELGPHAPMIAGMTLLSSIPSDPWRLILAVDFIDYDGDLGGGTAQVFANGEGAPSSQPDLAPLFSASGGVPLNATSGSFALPLRVANTTPDGARLQVMVRLVDSGGNRSNCYRLELGFSLF